MNTAIGEAIGQINSFDIAVVQALPTQDISTHTIYLVPKIGETNDVYDEYVYINNNWEMVGNTQIDLSDYALKSELPTKVSDLTDDSGHYTKPATGIPASDLADGVIPDVPVQDVQVNGTSILDAQGVANVPVANPSTGDPGVISVISYESGLRVADNGRLGVVTADPSIIKAGTNSLRSLVPSRQHQSTFYGLAKAAGVDMASSSNPVGTYTDEAKIAIQKMLGIYEAPWELIREDTFTNAEAGEYIVNVDGNGNPFELTDLVFQVTTPANEAFAINNYGAVEFYYGSSSSAYISALLNALSGPKTNVWFATVHLLNKGNAVFFWNSAFSESGNSKAMLVRNQNDFIPNNLIISKIRFRNVQGKLSYKLYGKRKWN